MPSKDGEAAEDGDPKLDAMMARIAALPPVRHNPLTEGIAATMARAEAIARSGMRARARDGQRLGEIFADGMREGIEEAARERAADAGGDEG